MFRVVKKCPNLQNLQNRDLAKFAKNCIVLRRDPVDEASKIAKIGVLQKFEIAQNWANFRGAILHTCTA